MYYQGNDINTLIHNVTRTYQPEITELVPLTNYSLQYIDGTVPSHQFSLPQVNMTNSDTPPLTSQFYIVQPTSNITQIYLIAIQSLHLQYCEDYYLSRFSDHKQTVSRFL